MIIGGVLGQVCYWVGTYVVMKKVVIPIVEPTAKKAIEVIKTIKEKRTEKKD